MENPIVSGSTPVSVPLPPEREGPSGGQTTTAARKEAMAAAPAPKSEGTEGRVDIKAIKISSGTNAVLENVKSSEKESLGLLSYFFGKNVSIISILHDLKVTLGLVKNADK